jgi:hypothetical protein
MRPTESEIRERAEQVHRQYVAQRDREQFAAMRIELRAMVEEEETQEYVRYSNQQYADDIRAANNHK